jgi:ketosteroid isomerase-like protein
MPSFARHATPLIALLLVFAAGLAGRVAAQPDAADAGRVALDELAIMELAARFETTFDAGDVEGHLDTWVDDLSFESPFGSYQGKAAYRAWVEEFNRQAMAGGGTRHLVTNFEIEVAGDEATMTCYLVILGATTPPAVGFTTVFTDDRLRRVDGEWRFVHRTLEVDQELPRQPGQAATPAP